MKKTENKDFLMYNYTKTAKDIEDFKLKEIIVHIIGLFERFNISTGIYKYFGEVLLNSAKGGYNMTFSGHEIVKYLNKINRFDEFLAMNKTIKEEYGYKLLKITPDIYKKDDSVRSIGKFNQNSFSKVIYEIDYFNYTLWEIAKKYNNKNGCIVVKTPDKYSDYIEIDWSKDATAIYDNSLWKNKIKSEKTTILTGIITMSLIVSLVTLFAIYIIFYNSIEIKILSLILLEVFFMASITAISKFYINKIFIPKLIKIYKKDYLKHCDNIQKYISSEFSIWKTVNEVGWHNYNR